MKKIIRAFLLVLPIALAACNGNSVMGPDADDVKPNNTDNWILPG